MQLTKAPNRKVHYLKEKYFFHFLKEKQFFIFWKKNIFSLLNEPYRMTVQFYILKFTWTI